MPREKYTMNTETFDYPHDTLIALSRARAGVRGLLQQIDHPVARFTLSNVQEHLERVAADITQSMVTIISIEAERIDVEDSQKGI